MKAGNSGSRGPATLWPEWPGSRGEENRGGRGGSLVGARLAQGGGLCATCGLGGVCKRGLGCKTPPRPTPAGQGQSGGFSAPTQETEGTLNTAIPTPGSQRKSPLQKWSQLGNWTPWAWEEVPLQAAGPSLPWERTRAQRGCCCRAPAVFPTRADTGRALFALSQPGLCVRDPRAARGSEGAGRWMGGWRRQRLKMQGWRSGWGGGQAAATPAGKVGTRQLKVAAAAAGIRIFPGEKAGGGGLS